MRSFSRSLFIFLCVVPFQLHVVPYFCKAGAITDFQATGAEAVSVPLTELASVTVQQHKFVSYLETNYRESQKNDGLDSSATEMVCPACILPAWS